MELINRQAAIDAWKNDFKEYINALNMPKDDYNRIMEYIDEVPLAQPERKTGMTKEQVVFWLLLLRFNPDNNVLPNEVIDIAIEAIVTQPERPTGTWILVDNQRREDTANGNYAYICSNCLYTDVHAKSVHVPYCWHCGAKMKEKQNAIN